MVQISNPDISFLVLDSFFPNAPFGAIGTFAHMNIPSTKKLTWRVDPEEHGLDIDKAVVLPVSAGDAILFDFNLIHASGLNNTD